MNPHNTRMTPLQHHAMCLAAGGYWQLADALELISRNADNNSVGAIAHPFSSKPLIGFADDSYQENCTECYGSGTVVCDMGHRHECDECNGEGGTTVHELRRQTLDGQEVEPTDTLDRGGFMTLQDARITVRQYTRLIERLQGKVGAA